MSVSEMKARMARAYSSGKKPQFLHVLPGGADEAWMIGDALFIVPVIPADAPPALEYGLRLRREASFTGRCDHCDASFDVDVADDVYDSGPGPTVNVSPFLHNPNCPATDENLVPQMRAYVKKRSGSNIADDLDAASRRTRDKLAAIPNQVNIERTDEVSAKVNALIDERVANSQLCDHLRSDPAQTWYMHLFDRTWRCEECTLHFAEAIARGAYRLSVYEESKCDFCGRFSPTTLKTIILRVNMWVLQGEICRRCRPEWGYVVSSEEVQPR